MRIKTTLLGLCLALSLNLYAADFFLSGAGVGSTENRNAFAMDLSGGIVHETDNFRISWELGFNNSGKYPAPFLGDFFGDFSVDVREAGLEYRAGKLSFGLGRLPIKDVIDSPYSLFASGVNNKAMTAYMVYDDAHIYFSNRWIGLNRDLKSGIYFSNSTTTDITQDRGADLKTYAVRFGRLRLGFQDSAVYPGSYFDIDYFANLAPSFFVQYVGKASGRPGSRSGDQNSLLGLFGDYEGDNWYAYAQWLVDDINMNRFLNPGGTQNPDKMAISLGGHLDTDFGRFGLYGAAATKYTFESIGGKFYSYTYYPGSAVDYDSQIIPVPLEDQMIGYKYGENNAALTGTWSRRLGDLSLDTALEGVISGSKSPSNPWHEFHNFREDRQGTLFLNDAVLEKRLSVSGSGTLKLGNVDLDLLCRLGWVQNRLALVAVAADTLDGNAEPIWRPSSESGPLIEFRFGGRVAFGL